MNNRVNYMAYSNVIIVILIALMHEMIESISVWILFLFLMVIALLNGWYIQREIMKQKKMFQIINKEKNFSKEVLKSISTGIIVLKQNGKLEYISKSILKIFLDDISQDIKKNELEILKEKTIEQAIILAQSGENVILEEYKYKLKKQRNEKILKVKVSPFLENDISKSKDVIIFIEDITIEKKLRIKTENQYFSMFNSFIKFIDAKDSYTGRHSISVSKYVEEIILKSNNNEKEARDIRIAAALHDIGKIGISDDILDKPDSLTEEEYAVMKTHPVIGANLLGEVDDYENVSKLIKYHHERWDGKGYPNGLKENEIPKGAQIIAIADAFDAMTTNRVYRKAKSIEDAVIILQNEKWKQFNGDLVDEFIKIVKNSN